MSIQKTCPYCRGRGYITHIEALPDCGRAWTKRCIACEGTGFILYQETNADRIRAMSDEELAWELMVWRCEAVSKHHGVESKYPDTQQTILKWLQQSTEEDT